MCVYVHTGEQHTKKCVVFGWPVTYAVHMLNVCCWHCRNVLYYRLISFFSKTIGKKKRFYNADRLPVLCFSPLRNWKLKRHQTTKDCGYIVDSCVYIYYSYIYTPASIYANYICQARFTIFIWKDVLYTNRTTICLCVHKNRRLNVQEIFRPLI